MHHSQSLLKSPVESFKEFNDRLEATVKEVRPTSAALYVTSGAPLVVLERDDGAPLGSVRVLPLAASDAKEAARSQELLKRIALGNVRVSVLSGGDDYAFAIVLGLDQVETMPAAAEVAAKAETEKIKKKLKPARPASMKARE